MPQKNKQHSLLQWLSKSLWVDRTPAFSYGLAVLLAILFICQIYPLAFLEGKGGYFETGDAVQHVSGWLFYAQDRWHFPLLRTERLNYPEGVSIVFTDSIPLIALPLKTIASWIPPHFNYIGLWHAVAYVAQAIAATFLIRSLGLRHALGVLSAVILTLMWPAFLWRLSHTALMTHGIILFAFAFYFLGRHGQWHGSATSVAFIAINLIGLTVHPYFLAFCYPLFLAFLADQAVAGEGWKAQWPRLLSSAVVIGVMGVVLGYFGNGTTTTSGFDYYSMNLASPFCGGRLFVCAADATGGQGEGFNHFGAGVLFLLVCTIVVKWSAIKMLRRHYPALMLVLILFTLYALSSKIYLGPYKVLSYTLPSFFDKITGTFRASGRFFWGVGYAILFGSLVALLKKPSWRGVLLLAIALPLQWIDIEPLRGNVLRATVQPSANDLAAWVTVMTDIDQLRVYPAYGCGDVDVETYGFFQRLAAHYGKLIDTGYIARANANCDSKARAFETPFLERNLYVVSTRYLDKNPFGLPSGFFEVAQRGGCAKWGKVILCKAEATTNYWQRSGLRTEPITSLTLQPSAASWPANILPSQIGQVSNGRMIPIGKERRGFLTFGPYARLLSGHYRYAIDYASESTPIEQVGRWDIVLNGGNASPHELASDALYGTSGKVKRVAGNFVVENDGVPLEIRTFFQGGGDLQIISISLEKAIY